MLLWIHLSSYWHWSLIYPLSVLLVLVKAYLERYQQITYCWLSSLSANRFWRKHKILIARTTTTVLFSNEDVAIASLLTVALCTGLITYALYTKKDFTICGGMLFVLGSVFIFCSILSFFYTSRIIEIILIGFGLFLFSAYLIYDVQLIADGEH